MTKGQYFLFMWLKIEKSFSSIGHRTHKKVAKSSNDNNNNINNNNNIDDNKHFSNTGFRTREIKANLF